MKLHHVLLISFTCVLTIGCAQEGMKEDVKLAMPTTKETLLSPGTHNESLALQSGDVLRYTIVIPESFDGSSRTPLIVGLHYGGEVTPHYSRGFVDALVAPAFEELNAIIIAPDSLDGGWDSERNEEAVLELMDAVSVKYNVDQSKTLLTGFSMGGMGTWYLGSRHQQRFSALVPVAGAPRIPMPTEWETPVWILHSRADKVVPFGPTENFLNSLPADLRQKFELEVVEEIAHFSTGEFAKPLKASVPWIRKQWDK